MTTLSNTAQTLLVRTLHRSGLLAEDLDYHVVRASMVIMFFFFGYQKWWPYEAERLVPFISNGPLIWWLYPVFGHAGASYFLGLSEWTFGSLLLAGFWDKRLGVLGALGSTGTFIATVTIIPFMPEGWDIAAGGFPAMSGNVPFLMKDVVLLAVSLYLLKHDLVRLTRQYNNKVSDPANDTSPASESSPAFSSGFPRRRVAASRHWRSLASLRRRRGRPCSGCSFDRSSLLSLLTCSLMHDGVRPTSSLFKGMACNVLSLTSFGGAPYCRDEPGTVKCV